jgi:hypothetical protein
MKLTEIKTINDACLKVGVDYESFMTMIEPLPEHLQALAAMEIIIKALNDGWVNPLDGLTRVWFPWVYVYEQHEQQRMEKVYPDREDLIRFTRPDGSCGLADAASDSAWSVSYASIGSRLACKSESVCLYFVRNFKDLMAQYFLPMEDCKILEKYSR